MSPSLRLCSKRRDNKSGRREATIDSSKPQSPSQPIEYIIITDDPQSCFPVTANSSSNYVSTRRYSWLTFLPLSLLYQFRSVSNCYFLIVAILVYSIENPPLTPVTNLLPLLFVLAVSEIRELVEELSASKRDKVLNNERVALLRGQRKARELQPGDLVLIKKDEPFRADVVLLAASTPGDSCAILAAATAWIETASLDGETNLKLRKCLSETSNRKFTDLSGLRLRCNPPTADMYEFTGRLEDPITGSEYEEISLSNVAWRGSVLRNTEWVIGVVIFVGKETKMMMNLNALSLVPSKRTQLDKEMDSIVGKIIVLQIVLCLIPIFFFPDYSDNLRPWWNLFTNGSSRFWIFFILLDNLIPVSLWVISDMIKICQARVIEAYDDAGGVKCNSKNLHDELGRITHVLTDKTGTLTVNKMKFIGCSIGDEIFDASAAAPAVKPLKEMKLIFDGVLQPPTTLVEDIVKTFESRTWDSEQFMLTLALCHSCERVQEAITGRWINQSNSPDEACLVSLAADCNYIFSGRTRGGKGIIVEINGVKIEFDVLHTIPFTSERKRMTIVIRRARGDGDILVLSKGADSVMTPLCTADDVEFTNRVVEKFSMSGFRTLCIAAKSIDEEEWEKFEEQITSLNRQKSGISESADDETNSVTSAIESGLCLVGSTAVEDRLQEGVDSTLRSLRAGGIKVCMITGDKRETAVNIAVNCGLISSVNHVHVVEAPDRKFRLTRYVPKRIGGISGDDKFSVPSSKLMSSRCTTGKSFSYFEAPSQLTGGDSLSAVVEGHTLETILECRDMRNRLGDLLTSPWFESVVFCRVSPKQKGDIVKLINDRADGEEEDEKGGLGRFLNRHFGGPRDRKSTAQYSTLAIGDGANDVNMIKVANIGVGIAGSEGSQAANSSDYSVSEFRDLYKLLFVHGRWNLRRMKLFVGLTIFKNFCFVFTQYWFATVSQFSGVSVYDAIYLMVYNTVLGVFPLMFFGLFEKDFDIRQLTKSIAPKETIAVVKEMIVPKCYRDQVGRLKGEMGKWAIVGFFCSVIIFYPTWYSLFMSKAAIDSSGRMPDVWVGSSVVYTAEVLVCSGLILSVSRTWTWLVLFGVLGTYVSLYLILAIVYDQMIGGTNNGMSPLAFLQLKFWLLLVLVIGAIFIPVVAIKVLIQRLYSSTSVSIAQKIQNPHSCGKSPSV